MKEIYQLADLRNWKRAAANENPPIRLGVLGDPVAHSLSPLMQNAALAECGIDARYARFHILPNELTEALQRMRDLDFVGANLTVPHKVAAISLLNNIDDEARAIGAVNTIAWRDGATFGFNTDGVGFARALQESGGGDLQGMRILLLGAGGAARAIAYQCLRENVGELVLCNRDRKHAELLRDDLRPISSAAEVSVIEQNAVTLTEVLPRLRLIVNATSVGLRESDPLLVPAGSLRRNHIIFESIYQPPETKLLRAAAEVGARTINGQALLLYQGAAAFTLWFDLPAPMERMAQALTAPNE